MNPIRNEYFGSEIRTNPIGSVSDRICTPLMLTKPCPQIVNLVEKAASACFLISSHILGTVKGGAKRVDGGWVWVLEHPQSSGSRQII
jgi:hypothetical protein